MVALGSVWFWVGFLSANVHTSGKHLPVFFLDSWAIDKCTGGCVMIKLLLWPDFIFQGWTCQKWSVFTNSVQAYLYKHQQFLCHWFSCLKLQTQINRWGVYRIKFRFIWRLHARICVWRHTHAYVDFYFSSVISEGFCCAVCGTVLVCLHVYVWGHCVCVCVCVWDIGRQREEAREEVSDSHVLELGHVSQACCVRISWCPLCPS